MPPHGMTSGAIFGMPVGIGLGLVVAQLNHAKDPFKFGFAGALAGIVIGLTIGYLKNVTHQRYPSGRRAKEMEL